VQFYFDAIGEMLAWLVDHNVPARHQEQSLATSKKKPLAFVRGCCPKNVRTRAL